jgi:sentrin-specific protease 1
MFRDSQDMDEQLILEDNNDNSDNNELRCIQSNRRNIIFPGYNRKVFTKLVNFISSKEKNHVLKCQHSSFCTVKDLLNVFNPQTLINDTLMEHYFRLLAKSCKNQLVLSIEPFFLKYISKFRYDKATKSLRATIKNVFAYDKLIIPTHLQGNHWALIVVNIKNHTITIYDSKKTTFYEDQLFFIVKYLNKAYNKYENPDVAINWTLRLGESPSQNNTYDSGVFTCTNARYVLLEKPLYYTKEDTPLLRHRITYEILHNVLLPTP